MICNNCGYDVPDSSSYCPNCGSFISYRQNPGTDRICRLLNDKLFLVICILYSVSAGGGIVRFRFSVFTILTMIFLWLVFAKSRKNIVAANYLRCISGTIFASYITNWVLYGFIGFLSLIFAFFPGFIGMGGGLLRNILSEIGLPEGGYSQYISLASSVFIWLFAVILILLSAGGILLNIFGRRSIHRFAQSVYRNAENDSVPIVMCQKARTWMMVFGVICAVSAVLNITCFIEQGAKAAALIIGSILIKKYLGDIK